MKKTKGSEKEEKGKDNGKNNGTVLHQYLSQVRLETKKQLETYFTYKHRCIVVAYKNGNC